MSFVDAQTGWVTLSGQRSVRPSIVYATTDGTTTPIPVAAGLGQPSLYKVAFMDAQHGMAGASRYEWEVGGMAVAGASGAQLTPRTSGAYRVRAWAASCCGPWAAPSTVVLATAVPASPDFSVYPNPACSSLWVARPAAAPAAPVAGGDRPGGLAWHPGW